MNEEQIAFITEVYENQNVQELMSLQDFIQIYGNAIINRDFEKIKEYYILKNIKKITFNNKYLAVWFAIKKHSSFELIMIGKPKDLKDINTMSEGFKINKETEKAYGIHCGEEIWFWIPKSVLKTEEEIDQEINNILENELGKEKRYARWEYLRDLCAKHGLVRKTRRTISIATLELILDKNGIEYEK